MSRPEKHRAPRSFPFDTLNPSGKRRGTSKQSVNALETASSRGSLPVCESPVCPEQVKPGARGSPKRFCSTDCRLNAWAIRRVAKLLKGFSDEKVLEVLRGRS